MVRVYFNGRGCDAAPGATALDALRGADPALGEQVAAGTRALVDSRGLPVEPTVAVYAGAIFRVVSARAARPEAGAEQA